MSTRAHVQIADSIPEAEHNGVLLYHHYDGYIEWMVPEIVRRLMTAKETILQYRFGGEHMWYCERVAAMFIAHSVDQDAPYNNRIPRFVPADCWHGDVEYFYRVLLCPPWHWVIKAYKVKSGGSLADADLEYIGKWSCRDAVLRIGNWEGPNPIAVPYPDKEKEVGDERDGENGQLDAGA